MLLVWTNQSRLDCKARLVHVISGVSVNRFINIAIIATQHHEGNDEFVTVHSR
jgi:hypothetical protein